MKAKLFNIYIIHLRTGRPAVIDFWRKRADGSVFSRLIQVNTEYSSGRLNRVLKGAKIDSLFADRNSLSVDINL